MSTILTDLTEKQFEEHVRPFISVAKRDYECSNSVVQGFQLRSLSIAYRLPMGRAPD